MLAHVADPRICTLGEGPLWHPERQQLFRFDIINQRLLSHDESGPLDWDFPEAVSAAGWIDRDTLMIVSATGFWRFEIATGERSQLAPLEADNPHTRSNDGRTDPVGGFWVGTMGYDGEAGKGALYRYFRGEVRRLFDRISIPNAICFSPDRTTAYFADTAEGILWKQYIDRAGWPAGRREVLIDFGRVGLNPDGAVCDAQGNLWIAQWGAWRVACHRPDGQFIDAISVPAQHVTCPAFAGADLSDLCMTTATQGLAKDALAHQPNAGRLFTAKAGVGGQPEHRFVP